AVRAYFRGRCRFCLWRRRRSDRSRLRCRERGAGGACPSRKPHPALTYLQLERASAILLDRPAHPLFVGLLHSYGPHFRSLYAHPDPHRVPNSAHGRESRAASATARAQPEKPERHGGAAIIEIPAQLDGAAAVVVLSRRANAARSSAVGAIEAAGDFGDVNQTARFVRKVRERGGGLAPAHGQVASSRKFWEDRGGVQ